MSKSSKLANAYKEVLQELKNAQELVASLPRGYISRKTISGHTYHYLQWREGTHVLSTYVNDNLVALTQAKIDVRKAAEELVKVLKASLKKTEKELRKVGYTEEEIQALRG